MGTSYSCNYATFTGLTWKGSTLFHDGNKTYLFLKRFIDDKFGIWLGTNEEFQLLMEEIHPCSQLQWMTEG